MRYVSLASHFPTLSSWPVAFVPGLGLNVWNVSVDTVCTRCYWERQVLDALGVNNGQPVADAGGWVARRINV